MGRWSYWCPRCKKKQITNYMIGNKSRLAVWYCRKCHLMFKARKDEFERVSFKYLVDNGRIVKGGIENGRVF